MGICLLRGGLSVLNVNVFFGIVPNVFFVRYIGKDNVPIISRKGDMLRRST